MTPRPQPRPPGADSREGWACISEGLCPLDLARLVPRAGMGICPVCAHGWWVRSNEDSTVTAGVVQTYMQVPTDPITAARLPYTDFRVVHDPDTAGGRRRPIPPTIRLR